MAGQGEDQQLHEDDGSTVMDLEPECSGQHTISGHAGRPAPQAQQQRRRGHGPAQHAAAIPEEGLSDMATAAEASVTLSGLSARGGRASTSASLSIAETARRFAAARASGGPSKPAAAAAQPGSLTSGPRIDLSSVVHSLRAQQQHPHHRQAPGAAGAAAEPLIPGARPHGKPPPAVPLVATSAATTTATAVTMAAGATGGGSGAGARAPQASGSVASGQSTLSSRRRKAQFIYGNYHGYYGYRCVAFL